MSLSEELKAKATAYLNDDPQLQGEIPSTLLCDFVIEKYKQHRNFSVSDSESYVESDLRDHMATLAMAVVDLYAKTGAEGEKSHREKNITREYENAYISSSLFSDILPLVQMIK